LKSAKSIVCCLLIVALLMPAGSASAQGRSSEVVIQTTKTAFKKTDILVNMLDVLSGGRASVQAAEMMHSVIYSDLDYSGLMRAGTAEAQADSMDFEFIIEGTVEGPLRDAEEVGENAPTTLSLNLLTWPGRQLLMNKRYRPLPSQLRATAHHFANEVIYWVSGEPGICLSRIVFSRGRDDRRDLYAVDYDGYNLLRLTANRELNLCPSWSPDGKEIAFTSYRRGQQGLYRLDTSNGQVELIIAESGLNYGADWHPDGQELVLSLSHPGNPEIFRIDKQGMILKRLTVSNAIEISPSWSPGGRDLVFTSDRTGSPQLYIIDADGAGRRRLTFEGNYNDSAVWSPGGDKIVYATRSGDYTQIVVMKSTGEDRRVLTDGRWRNSEDPSWAPDGRHIVFASDRTGTFKLYVYDVLEDSFRQLTFGDSPDITPAWSR
jgi:TolB protein